MDLREELENKLPMWFLERDVYLAAALCNVDYKFEQVRETERAIEVKITYSKNNLTSPWTKWIPKSLLK